MTVDQSGAISDHSLIIANIVLELPILPVGATVSRHQWVKFNEVEFRKDLAQSDLITSPPANCDEYFTCYDDTLNRVLNIHMPLRAKVHRRCPSATPWFNSVCGRAKVKTRRLEKFYRATRLMDQGAVTSTRSTVAFRHWHIQTDVQRRVFQMAYFNFWSNSISSSDSKSLWRKMNSLLNPSESITRPHTADDFASYFTGKVDAIRANTSGEPYRTVTRWLVLPLSSYDGVTVEEISNIVQKRHQSSVT